MTSIWVSQRLRDPSAAVPVSTGSTVICSTSSVSVLEHITVYETLSLCANSFTALMLDAVKKADGIK